MKDLFRTQEIPPYLMWLRYCKGEGTRYVRRSRNLSQAMSDGKYNKPVRKSLRAQISLRMSKEDMDRQTRISAVSLARAATGNLSQLLP